SESASRSPPHRIVAFALPAGSVFTIDGVPLTVTVSLTAGTRGGGCGCGCCRSISASQIVHMRRLSGTARARAVKMCHVFDKIRQDRLTNLQGAPRSGT